MNAIVPSTLAKEAIAIGFKNHWRFRAVQETTYKKEWRTETITEAPQTAQERLDALRTAGISFKTILIAHEAPRLLTAPLPIKEKKKVEAVKVDPFPILEVLGFIVTFFFQAILLDPALIVVLEDGTWLEVMTWYE